MTVIETTPPYISSKENLTLSEGSLLRVDCQSDNLVALDPRLTWYFPNGTRYENGSNLILEVNRTLAGVYRCVLSRSTLDLSLHTLFFNLSVIGKHFINYIFCLMFPNVDMIKIYATWQSE